MGKITLQGKATMVFKALLFAIMTQEFVKSLWVGPVLFMIIDHGRIQKCFLKKNDYFDNQQYLIGDCAFTQSDTMIPVYKQPFGGRLSPLKEKFNSVLAKARVRSEHCIGLLKGRFQYLKGIRVRLKGRKDMIKINRIITASAILHNLLIASAYDEAWIEIDSEEEVIGDDDIPCDQRRDQLLNYIREQLY